MRGSVVSPLLAAALVAVLFLLVGPGTGIAAAASPETRLETRNTYGTYLVAPKCCAGCSYPSGCCCAARSFPITTTRYLGKVLTTTKRVTFTSTVTAGSVRGRRQIRELDAADVMWSNGNSAFFERDDAASARHLCPVCPSGAAIARSGSGSYCCPPRKTFTKTVSRKPMTTTVLMLRSITITVAPVKFSGRIYTDKNGNTNYDPKVDLPASNVPIVLVTGLRAAYPSIIDRTITGADGSYNLSGLAPTGNMVGLSLAYEPSNPLITATVGPTGVSGGSTVVVPVSTTTATATQGGQMTTQAGGATTTAESNGKVTTTKASGGQTTAVAGQTTKASGQTTKAVIQTTKAAVPQTTKAVAVVTSTASETTTKETTTKSMTTTEKTSSTSKSQTTTETQTTTTSMTRTSTTTTKVIQGEESFNTTGTHSWTVPPEVTKIAVVCIGGGGYGNADYAGGGGGMIWVNDLPVTAGDTYTVVIGGGGTSSSTDGKGGDSVFSNGTVDMFKAFGGWGEDLTYGVLHGYGGSGTISEPWRSAGQVGFMFNDGGMGVSGGGGAGGYMGAGGQGGAAAGAGIDGDYMSGAGGGGGGSNGSGGGSGGGVGLYGQTTTGAGGAAGAGGGGGSGGAAGGSDTCTGACGGKFGGGGGIGGHEGGAGGCRVIWGSGRSFPTAGGPR